jgi:hypothetical protein
LLNPGLNVNSIQYANGQSCKFTCSNTSIPPGIEFLHIRVPYSNERQKQVLGRLSISYSGTIKDRSKFMAYVKDQIKPEFTVIRPDSIAYPVFAEPNWESLIRYYESSRFFYEVKIKSPKGVPVVAPGDCIKKEEIGKCRVYTYRSVVPTSRIFIARGAFTTQQKGDIVFYALDKYSRKENEQVILNANNALNLYKNLLGFPLFDVTKVIIENPEGYGSSMAQDSIVIAENELRNVTSSKILFHEIAHSFGPLGGPEWICEGFAEFMGITAVSKLESSEKAAKLMHKAHADYESIIAEAPECRGLNGGKRSAYNGGILFMKGLCEKVGFSTLGAIMKKYASEEKPLSISKFKNVAEETSQMDLSAFFDYWH